MGFSTTERSNLHRQSGHSTDRALHLPPGRVFFIPFRSVPSRFFSFRFVDRAGSLLFALCVYVTPVFVSGEYVAGSRG